jgi:hypothetical protein
MKWHNKEGQGSPWTQASQAHKARGPAGAFVIEEIVDFVCLQSGRRW